jgi:hypothetical protein
MSYLFYIGLGIAINVAIAIIGISLKKKRPKMSYTEYLERYGRSEGYTGDDAKRFMGGESSDKDDKSDQ